MMSEKKPAPTKPPAGPAVVTAAELRTRKKGDRPAEMLASRELYRGKIITLNRDTVRLPDGTTTDMDVARHPGASAVVPFMSGPLGDEPQILMLRQYRFAAGGYLYEIPAGRLDEGETPVECALRELKEETGLRAKRWTRLFSLYMSPGFLAEKMTIFLATELTAGEQHVMEDERIETRWFTSNELDRLIGAGKMPDAKTQIGFLTWKRYRAVRSLAKRTS